MKLSVIVPFYNEEENVSPLADELSGIESGYDFFEALFVDDGSTDHTWQQINRARERFPFVRGLQHQSNSGQSAAMLTGLKAAEGEVVATLDGDLQNDPGDIPALTDQLGAYDVVCGYRGERKDSWSKLLASRIGNTVRNWFTHDHVRDTGCSLKVFKRTCIDDIPPVDGVHRFMPAYFKLNGRTLIEARVGHRERMHGESKYTNLKRLPRTVFDLIGFCWYRRRLIKQPQHKL